MGILNELGFPTIVTRGTHNSHSLPGVLGFGAAVVCQLAYVETLGTVVAQENTSRVGEREVSVKRECIVKLFSPPH